MIEMLTRKKFCPESLKKGVILSSQMKTIKKVLCAFDNFYITVVHIT